LDKFKPFWLRSPGPGRQQQEPIFSLKFLVKTRQQYKSLVEPWTGHLAFQVQKILAKSHFFACCQKSSFFYAQLL